MFSTLTFGQGQPFCTLGVFSGNGGYFAIVDSTGATVWTSLGRISPIQDTVSSGMPLPQNTRLFSANGLYFLVLQVRVVQCIYMQKNHFAGMSRKSVHCA